MGNSGVRKNILFATLGLAILITGLALAMSMIIQGNMRILLYIFIGAGALIFGENLGVAIKNYFPAREIEIEIKDERNMAIRNMAKAKAFDLMLKVFLILLFVFGAMRVNMFLLLVFFAAYLLVVLSSVYYWIKYQEKM